jgi:DNA-binding response OmpR family regulator
MLTALQTPGEQIEDLQKYVVDYITKPFEPEVLLATCETYLAYLEKMQTAVSKFKGDAGSIRQRMRDAGCTEVTIELMRRPDWEDDQVFAVASNGDYVYGFPPEPA